MHLPVVCRVTGFIDDLPQATKKSYATVHPLSDCFDLFKQIQEKRLSGNNRLFSDSTL